MGGCRGGLLGAAPLLAAALLAAALAGCAAATNTGVTVTGSTLTVYASQPVGGVGTQEAQDLIAGERLALSQAGGQVGRFAVKLKVLGSAKLSDDARTALLDQSAVAYVGDVVPGTSSQSLGITNGPSNQPLLQLSPTDNAVELTQPSPVVANSPTKYYEALSTNKRTFGRVVPVDTHDATALAGWLSTSRVKKLFVATDGNSGVEGDYGRAIAYAVAQAAQQRGIAVQQGLGRPTVQQVTASGADALFMGTNAQSAAADLFNAVAAVRPRLALYGSAALAYDTFAAGLIPAAQANFLAVRPGFLNNRALTAAGVKFVADFKAATGRDPGPGGGDAIFGYEAMALVLDVLRRAGANAANHAALIADFHATNGRASVLGTYSIDGDGDTSLKPAPIILEHVVLGRLAPFKALPAQG